MRYFLLRLYTIKITHLPNFDSLNLDNYHIISNNILNEFEISPPLTRQRSSCLKCINLILILNYP